MKLLSSLVAAALAVSAVQAIPATNSGLLNGDRVEVPPTDPIDRIDFYRQKIQRYETPIIQTYLARVALDGSIEGEEEKTAEFFADASKFKKDFFAQPNSENEHWLEEKSGHAFASVNSYPPAVNYVTKVVLPKDAVLDKPVVGKGIFPTGRRPQDEDNIVDFIKAKIQVDQSSDLMLDQASVILLDASLLRLVSARILLGREIALAKFDSQKKTYCQLLTNQPIQKKDILESLTNHKQVVNILSRVRSKTKASTQTFYGDAETLYPKHTTDNLLRLFQAYIIPITTEIELATIIAQAPHCTK
ncbi:hypothetical protein NDA11_003346 [Ustilago hordei]|uniref:chorismate mutase n=1 Tax=Ustilago hordei TaxID=120017 RepID=I2FRC1_USTHO|nr:putative secreted chorismate mutase [Ustilago hordei]KAJ1042747.1 hypothetical protein NDA10_000094 [Ustilago hordei]KAJ1572827.1 hypothetical protein NDA15_005240 [Ustilago hordei]KAJ1575212.1 hypothetical protein NDA11_003346 [Ustilago hordei]KAJ1575782.1 hypothetical protein NDA12_005414 [Ustilago hordei]KAJ1598072.1 hypothetical protein NDA14_003592 [Ustilago hordei]